MGNEGKVTGMIEANKIYAAWLREAKRFANSKARIFGSLGLPFFFLIAVGAGLTGVVQGFNYQTFIIPGIVGMTLLFSSMFAGVSVIWDREFGFLKEMLVAPMSRTSIVLGRVLGGASISVFQASIILLIGFLLGLQFFGIHSLIAALFFMTLVSMGFVAVGIAMASLMSDVEGFQVIINFVIFPIFFLSNALFPSDKLPAWLQVVASANPLSWAVSALRDILVYNNYANLVMPAVLLILFDAAAILVAGHFFNKTGI